VMMRLTGELVEEVDTEPDWLDPNAVFAAAGAPEAALVDGSGGAGVSSDDDDGLSGAEALKEFLGPTGDVWDDVGTGAGEELDWLDGSVWRPRRHGPRPADSRDYIDTKECLKSAFRADWEGTSGYAFQHPDGQASRAFGCTTMTKGIVEKIANVLEGWYPLLLRIFTYYSCIGADVSNNINGIPSAGFAQLLADAGLDVDVESRSGFSHFARSHDGDGWDLIWVAINSSKESTNQASWNTRERFTRGEFLEFVVRAAVNERTPPVQMVDNVKDFCAGMCETLALNPDAKQIFHRDDRFRRESCYGRETAAMLKHHDETLRNVFAVYAERGTGGVDPNGQSDMLSAAEWMALMRDLGFTKECGVRQLFLIFAQSRMATVMESSSKTGQLTQLSYEGFLEVMVRLSLLKALPTDKELEKRDYQYPGEYVGALLSRGTTFYATWVAASKRRQAAGRGDSVFRRVDMLVLLVVSVMQYGVEMQPGGPTVLLRGHPDEALSFEEVNKYFKRPTRGVFQSDYSMAFTDN